MSKENPAMPHDPKHRREVCDAICERAGRVEEELREGLELVSKVEKSVSIFGSSRFSENNVHYKQARRIAGELAKRGFSIVTGGGPGIMEAANRGASDVGGRSVGLNINLPFEQELNEYSTEFMDFHYFFTRKVALAYAAEAYIFFPGGYGTMDEFFEIITLVQTKKMPKVPVILVGRDYWDYLDKFIRHELYEDHKAINNEDRELYTITDDESEVIKIVENAPMRHED